MGGFKDTATKQKLADEANQPPIAGAAQEQPAAASAPAKCFGPLDSYDTNIAEIYIGEGRRPVDPDAVAKIAASMKAVGQLQPILLRWVEGDVTLPDGTEVDAAWHLIFGLHRIEAAKLLGWVSIFYCDVEAGDREARMVEIAENLHRAELTVLQRSQHVSEWLKLASEEEAEKAVLPQPAAKPPGRPKGGTRKAARDIGIDEDAARRAEKIDRLAPEAKEEARNLGLDDNQTALLKAAAEPTPEAQVAALVQHAAPKPEKPAATVTAPAAASGAEDDADQTAKRLRKIIMNFALATESLDLDQAISAAPERQRVGCSLKPAEAPVPAEAAPQPALPSPSPAPSTAPVFKAVWSGCRKPNQVCGYQNCVKGGRCLQPVLH